MSEQYELPGEWWTAPAESLDGDGIVMVTGRSDVAKFRANPKFSIRLTVTWPYDGAMPNDEEAAAMQEVTEALGKTFATDPVAVLTGIYTGDGQRNWVFYTLSTHIFARKLNEALAAMPLLPLTMTAENDPAWHEYDEMSELAPV